MRRTRKRRDRRKKLKRRKRLSGTGLKVIQDIPVSGYRLIKKSPEDEAAFRRTQIMCERRVKSVL